MTAKNTTTFASYKLRNTVSETINAVWVFYIRIQLVPFFCSRQKEQFFRKSHFVLSWGVVSEFRVILLKFVSNYATKTAWSLVFNDFQKVTKFPIPSQISLGNSSPNSWNGFSLVVSLKEPVIVNEALYSTDSILWWKEF